MRNGCGAPPLVVVGYPYYSAANTRQNYKKMWERRILTAHFHGYSEAALGVLQLDQTNNALFVDTQRGRIASFGEGGRT